MERNKDYGLYSIIASVAGLILGFRIVGGILGIYFANEAQKNGQDMSMANAGKIVGIIDIILGIFIVFVLLIFLAVFGVSVFC